MYEGARGCCFVSEIAGSEGKDKYYFSHYMCSKMKKKKRNRRKKYKQALILLSIVGIFVIIVIAALYQTPESPPRLPSADFFEISGLDAQGFIEDNGTELILHLLTFNLTAVNGSARNVIVHNLGVSEEVWWEPFIELGTMAQGEVKAVQLSTEQGVYIPLTNITGEGEVFPVSIRITSEETSRVPQEQLITIYLVESDIYTY